MNAVDVVSFPSGPFETNAYLIIDRKSLECAIVDPAPESAESLIAAIDQRNLMPKLVILTHSHWDHIADVKILKERFHPTVVIHAEDAPNLIAPGSDGLPCWIAIEGVSPDRLLTDGDEIYIGSTRWTVIHTPGHTPGGICLYCPAEQILISGDTLFKGTIGALHFPTGNAEKMWQSLKKLEKLPNETILFPGHGPKTTIGEETWLSRAKELFGS